MFEDRFECHLGVGVGATGVWRVEARDAKHSTIHEMPFSHQTKKLLCLKRR